MRTSQSHVISRYCPSSTASVWPGSVYQYVQLTTKLQISHLRKYRVTSYDATWPDQQEKIIVVDPQVVSRPSSIQWHVLYGTVYVTTGP